MISGLDSLEKIVYKVHQMIVHKVKGLHSMLKKKSYTIVNHILSIQILTQHESSYPGDQNQLSLKSNPTNQYLLSKGI